MDAHDAMIRSALQRHRGREVKTVGDGSLVTFDSTSRAVREAKEIVKATSDMGIEVRAGVHTGEVEVRTDDVVGLSVSIAKRVCDLAGSGEVLVSRPVTDLVVGSAFEFTERGNHDLKGVPGTWKLFAVKS
jgi:class 3 adenylate cyclase